MLHQLVHRTRRTSQLLSILVASTFLFSIAAPFAVAVPAPSIVEVPELAVPEVAPVEPVPEPPKVDAPVPVVSEPAQPEPVVVSPVEPVIEVSGPKVSDPVESGLVGPVIKPASTQPDEGSVPKDTRCEILSASGASAWRSLLQVSVVGGSATFTIPADACPLELTFSSYTWPDDVTPNLGNGYPYDVQIHVASVTGTYGPGTHTVTVPMPDCGYFQTDLYLGPPIYVLFSNGHPTDKIIDWDLGGQPCPPVPSDLTVVKFNDLDEDGVMDEGEPVIQGVDITVSGPEYLQTIPTDAAGESLFAELAAGEYTVDETVPEGWHATVTLPIGITLAEGQDATVYVGNAEDELPFTAPDLAIEKSANVTTAAPGDLVTYTLTYRNVGEGSASDFVITDDFDERYVVVVDAVGGVVVDGTIVWNIAGPLTAEDGPVVIVYTVRVLDDVPNGSTDVANVVTIFHPDDENLTNNADDDVIVVEDPFLPFTPNPDPDPDPEPFLPYTGSESMILLAAIAFSAIAGFALRFSVKA